MSFRRKICSVVITLCFLLTAMSPPSSSYASEPELLQVEVPGRFLQSEMRESLELINEFRTGDDTWYWNSDNTSKTRFNGEGQTKLQPLVYDYNLEKIAMQRAVELAVEFSHNRPDGTSFTLGESPLTMYTAFGENIAMGQRTAEEAFYSWLEEDDPYEWQGHRRNMLDKRFNVVGLGAFECNGDCYWVQEFGYSDLETTEIPANDGQYTGIVECLPVYAASLLHSSDDSIKVFRQHVLPYSNGTESLRYKHELKTNQFIAVDEIPETMTVLVPSYDEIGRFLGLSEMTSDEYAAAQQNASEVKILCVDGEFAPVAEAAGITLDQ